jgi:hypothetical protein
MRKLSFIGIGTLVLGLAIGAAACGSDGDDGDGAGASGASSGTNSGGSGSGSGAEGGTGSGASSAGGSGSSAGGAGSGGSGSGGALSYCAQSCAEAADCCPDGLPDCPGDAYPNNYGCEEGLCTPPQCATDDECTFGGAVPGNGCLTISDFKICVPTCDGDADCTAPLTCAGEDDDGKKYCTGEAPAGCTTDADCPAGYGGICDVDSGSCTCGEDADCSGAGVDTCVEP